MSDYPSNNRNGNNNSSSNHNNSNNNSGGIPRSAWWFLLPVLLGIIGGIIAYFVLRSDDPRKARDCLLLGVILTVIFVAVDVAVLGSLFLLD